MSQIFSPPERFNLVDYLLFDRLAEGRGEKIALICGERRLTYAEVGAQARAWAHALAHRGVRREERVLIALPDGVEFVGALLGTLTLGAVVVMLNPGLSREEVAAQLDFTRASLAIIHAETEAAFRSEKAKSPWLERGFLLVGRPEDPDSFERVADFESKFTTASTHRDEAAIWLFSGGTTGRPKAVVQPHRSIANTTELYAKGALGYGPDDLTLSVPKLYFGYATGSNLFFPFAVGAATVLFPESPTPALLFDLIEKHRPTILINVPTMIGKMVDHESADQRDLSSLRCVTSAGEALSGTLHARWHDLFGVPLLDGLGTAEMWHIFVSNRPDDVRPGTLGRVVDGFEIFVRDEAGNDVADGEVGRLWVRGGSRALGYWQNHDLSQQAFRGDFYVSGDLIKREEDGTVTYCGRADDVMKVGGRWLIPAEVEDCLLGHDAVKECAVIGVADAQGLVKPIAFVLVNDENQNRNLEAELKEFALERLAAYKHPRRVVVLQSFPRTHLGKVDRGKLRGLA
jgi:benzoate-CoA ligase family protein